MTKLLKYIHSRKARDLLALTFCPQRCVATMFSDSTNVAYVIQIVEDDSSCIGGSWETTDSINANHMKMCKFCDEDDEGYRKTKGVVSGYLGEIREARLRECT
jgi:hypothetical protein